MTVAALYVDPHGVYSGLPSVEVWDEARDARTYPGPWPVVAHPPCQRWGRLAGGIERRFGYAVGDDGGCFAAALDAVRRFGGVLEHPAYTHAYAAHGLTAPSVRAGWTSCMDGGWTAYVEQGRYGHPVKKATWLYVYGVEPAELAWGYVRDDEGAGAGNSGDWTRRIRRGDWTASATPPAFRDVLLAMARSAGKHEHELTHRRR